MNLVCSRPLLPVTSFFCDFLQRLVLIPRILLIKNEALLSKLSFGFLLLCLAHGARVQASVRDMEPPQVAEFSVSPGTVDVSQGDGSVKVTMRITDDVVGFNQGYFAIFFAWYFQ